MNLTRFLARLDKLCIDPDTLSPDLRAIDTKIAEIDATLRTLPNLDAELRDVRAAFRAGKLTAPEMQAKSAELGQRREDFIANRPGLYTTRQELLKDAERAVSRAADDFVISVLQPRVKLIRAEVSSAGRKLSELGILDPVDAADAGLYDDWTALVLAAQEWRRIEELLADFATAGWTSPGTLDWLKFDHGDTTNRPLGEPTPKIKAPATLRLYELIRVGHGPNLKTPADLREARRRRDILDKIAEAERRGRGSTSYGLPTTTELGALATSLTQAEPRTFEPITNRHAPIAQPEPEPTPQPAAVSGPTFTGEPTPGPTLQQIIASIPG